NDVDPVEQVPRHGLEPRPARRESVHAIAAVAHELDAVVRLDARAAAIANAPKIRLHPWFPRLTAVDVVGEVHRVAVGVNDLLEVPAKDVVWRLVILQARVLALAIDETGTILGCDLPGVAGRAIAAADDALEAAFHAADEHTITLARSRMHKVG